MKLSKVFITAMTVALSANSWAADVVLPEGTPVRLRIMRTVSSATATEGDKVDFQTLDDVSSAGAVVIPKGSTAIATITNAEAKKRMARGGKLSLNIDYVTLPNNDRVPLRGVQNLRGGGHAGAMTGAMVATAIVAWPAAPVFLLMHGKDVTVPEGQETTVYTNSNYALKNSLPAASVAPLERAKSTGATMTNEDVLKLKRSGLNDDLIVQRINLSTGAYKLDPDDLLNLKKSGVSDAVLSAMMNAAVH